MSLGANELLADVRLKTYKYPTSNPAKVKEERPLFVVKKDMKCHHPNPTKTKIEIENVSSEADCYNKIFQRVLCEGPQTDWISGRETYEDHMTKTKHWDNPSLDEDCLPWSTKPDADQGKYVTSHGATGNTCGKYNHDQYWCYTASGWGNCRQPNEFKPFGNPKINDLRFEYNKTTNECFLLPGAEQGGNDYSGCEKPYGDAELVDDNGTVYNRAEGIPASLAATLYGEDVYGNDFLETRGLKIADIFKTYVNCKTKTSTLFKVPTSCPAGYGLYSGKCFECPANMYSEGGKGKCQMKTTSCGSGEKLMKYGVTRDDECYTNDTAAQCLDPDNRDWVIENGICRDVVSRPAVRGTYDICDDACQSKMVW